MTVSVKAPTSTTGSIQLNGSDVLTIDSSGNLTVPNNLSVTGTAPIPDSLSTASGSAPSYSARAWVNFNGTGTVAIRASGNVSSITDNNVGDYRVNFSTAMPDTNYCVTGSCQGVGGSDIVDFGSFGFSGNPTVTPTTSQVAIGAFAYSGAGVDTAIVSVAVFR
jgi:hypothetical protein